LNIPQPDQRTKEWYEFRHNHITASNAWKCLGTASSINQIILEKLTPLNVEKYKPSLNDNPMTWGQRFEDISIMFYENKYNVKVDDLGCLEHPEHTFLAASPDGIITSKNNNSRLLEIKNVVSRKITKIPKPDYWMQMQLQMEVCDIDECDFLETKFVEYGGFSEFKCDINETNKGIIMMFVKNNEIPVYEYSELYKNIEDIEKWMDEKMDYYEKVENITWFKNIYWKMEEFSCIMVKRNKIWFENAIQKIKDVWEIIVKERENDCKNIDNYKPKKRIKVEKKEQEVQQNIVTDVVSNNIIDSNIEVL
jgi:putative phage-type endonuclease